MCSIIIREKLKAVKVSTIYNKRYQKFWKWIIKRSVKRSPNNGQSKRQVNSLTIIYENRIKMHLSSKVL